MLPIYGATFKVIAGFYLGCTGWLSSPYEVYTDRFNVEMSCQYKVKNTTITDTFRIPMDLKDLEITSEPRK